MKRRLLLPLLLAIFLIPITKPDLPLAQTPSLVRAIILSWDGTVPSTVHDLLRRGKLPNLEKLIAGGAFADSVMTVFPSKTAPGHASLWSGAPPRVTGISGNNMPRTPRSQFTILESVLGFDSRWLRAEPVWIPAARMGRRVILSHGPFFGERAEHVVALAGYAGSAGRDGVITARTASIDPAQNWKHLPQTNATPLEVRFTIGATQLFGLLIDDPGDSVRGYDTLIVTETRDGLQSKATLKAGFSQLGDLGKWSRSIEIKVPGQLTAGTYLRLFDLRADGTDFLLYFTRPMRELSSHPGVLAQLTSAAGTFIGNGARGLYRQGALGPTIAAGGDGTAERRYLETVMLTQRQLMETTRWLMQNLPWDLLFTYTPYPDEAEHLWGGYLEPGLPGFRKGLADRLRPSLEEVYRTCDAFLGLLMKLRPPNTVIALVSDHGIEGVHRAAAINVALRKAGLLVLDPQGHVDLAKTKALYPPMNNGYILINSTDRKGGIVRPEARLEVVNQIRRALSEVRDGGRQVVTAIFDAQTEGERMGIGGEAGGDVYLDLLPGYAFDGRVISKESIVELQPSGAHGFNPLRPSMRTIMVLNGPGVAAGKQLKEARAIDFAPTLAKLIGISVPRDSSGRVLTEALSR